MVSIVTNYKSGNVTTITDEDGNKRDFAFDYSFWSHDGYRERPDGYLEATGDKYVDQEKVYRALGRTVLDNAW